MTCNNLSRLHFKANKILRMWLISITHVDTACVHWSDTINCPQGRYPADLLLVSKNSLHVEWPVLHSAEQKGATKRYKNTERHRSCLNE